MEFRGQQKLDDDVYGGDVPEQAYMESDSDLVTDAEAAAAVSKSEVLFASLHVSRFMYLRVCVFLMPAL